MLDLYEEYASQEEREANVMLEQAEIRLDKAILAFETADRMSDLAMREAECRLVMESGEVTDLVDYYEEATASQEEKKKGVITKIWEGVLSIIDKIKEFLFGSARKKVNPNEETEVDQSFLERHKKLGAVVKALKDFFAHPIGKFVTVLVASAGVVATFLAIKHAGKTVKMKKGQVNKMVDDAENQMNFIQKSVKSIFHKDLDKDAEKAPSKIGEITKKIAEHIKEGVNAVTRVPGNIAIKTGKKKLPEGVSKDEALYYRKYGLDVVESASSDDDIFGDMFQEDSYDDYAEDAGDISDIADLLASL